jgi:VIT1/CCC1 family predicted Fe2+/Mn2+ transporter
VTRHGNANSILEQLHAAHRTPRLFSRVVADLDAFRQQVESRALEESVRVQVAEENRSRRFEHAAAVAAIAFAVPALVFAALTVPVQDVTSGIHDIPAWAVIVIGLSALVTGAIAGSVGGRWISGRVPRTGKSD